MSNTNSEETRVGTCAACGQELIEYKSEIWHPYDVPNPCPASIYGKPGADNFIVDEEATKKINSE